MPYSPANASGALTLPLSCATFLLRMSFPFSSSARETRVRKSTVDDWQHESCSPPNLKLKSPTPNQEMEITASTSRAVRNRPASCARPRLAAQWCRPSRRTPQRSPSSWVIIQDPLCAPLHAQRNIHALNPNLSIPLSLDLAFPSHHRAGYSRPVTFKVSNSAMKNRESWAWALFPPSTKKLSRT